MHQSPWFSTTGLTSHTETVLFCLPYAGGGAAMYHRWARYIPASIALLPLRLPGREGRLKEPAYESMDQLVHDLTVALLPILQTHSSYALFGHSMGAAVGFELVHELLARGAAAPRHLFLSSCRGPRQPRDAILLHTMSTPDMLQELLERYGTRETTTADELALMELLAPTLRADLTLLERYQCQRTELLDCQTTVFGGAQDPGVSRVALEAWKHETTGPFATRLFPGGHFYLRQQEARLAEIVATALGHGPRSA